LLKIPVVVVAGVVVVVVVVDGVVVTVVDVVVVGSAATKTYLRTRITIFPAIRKIIATARHPSGSVAHGPPWATSVC